MMPRKTLITDLFEKKFRSSPTVTCHAPGRVNLIGDHTDYNDGFVFPIAIDYGTDVAASRRNDNLVKICAYDCGEQTKVFSLDNLKFDYNDMWINYVAGTLKALMRFFPQINGADIVVSGNVPQGAGLSSSASFEIAILKLFAELYQLDLSGVHAAQLGQEAENNFVGCNCGIMDQLISALGQQDKAMLLDCRQLTFESVSIPNKMSIVIVNSNVKRGLVDSEYNTRREQCEKVARFFNRKALRDVSIEELNSVKDSIDPVLFKRAHHVISENERTLEALQALNESDIQKLSNLMRDSHRSLKNDFEVTTQEIDKLVDILDQQLLNRGGVRMTGGGFGGCVVALIPDELVEKIVETTKREYLEKVGIRADVYICNASKGAFS